jgi:hypothetical protein
MRESTQIKEEWNVTREGTVDRKKKRPPPPLCRSNSSPLFLYPPTREDDQRASARAVPVVVKVMCVCGGVDGDEVVSLVSRYDDATERDVYIFLGARRKKSVDVVSNTSIRFFFFTTVYAKI